MSDLPGNLFEVGRVVRPQGLHGEMKIQPWTDTPGQWLDFYRSFFLERPKRLVQRFEV